MRKTISRIIKGAALAAVISIGGSLSAAEAAKDGTIRRTAWSFDRSEIDWNKGLDPAELNVDAARIEEMKQKFPMPDVFRSINLGPYVDGWVNPPPWPSCERPFDIVCNTPATTASCIGCSASCCWPKATGHRPLASGWAPSIRPG